MKDAIAGCGSRLSAGGFGSRSGVALVVTLGVLAILALMVTAFVLSARTERHSARHGRERTASRHYVDVALSDAMERIDRWTGFVPPGRFDYFESEARRDGITNAFTRNGLASIGGEGSVAARGLLRGSVSNEVPAALWAELATLQPGWIVIQGQDEDDPGRITGTNGRIAYVVMNLSGFLDANHVTSNELETLRRHEIRDAGLFLTERARDRANGFQLPAYVSLPDLQARNAGTAAPVSNLFVTSYDPGPDVVITNGAPYSNRSLALAPKFPINSWTNGFAFADPADPAAMAEHYRSSAFQHRWLAPVTNLFATIGFDTPEALAWNLVNYLDADRVPQSSASHPWQNDWPVEAVPLINEIAVASVPTNFVAGGHLNHYAPAIELWYPFVPRKIEPQDDAQLVVAVYTNWTSGTKSVATVMGPSAGEGFAFSNRIESMECETGREFVTVTMPEPFVSFPAMVSNVLTGRIETRYLPLGRVTYPAYDPVTGSVQVRTVENEIRLLARVLIGGQPVDEAMGYDPADPARADLVAFTNVCGYQVADPRRNGWPQRWERYQAGAGFGAAPGNAAFQCTLTATTNSNCHPWQGGLGQGLPLVHADRPMRRPGELGYLSLTNEWQSICLADPRTLATNSYGFSFTSGSVLDFFTARATNTAVRGLVHHATTWTNVVRAVLSDIPIGWEGNTWYLDDEGLDWMTTVYMDADQYVHDRRLIPIGVGDLCFSIGAIADYADGGDTNVVPNLGSDLKEDILRGLAERISFRQHVFGIVLAGQALSPANRPVAEQRAFAIILRDAHTGRWQLHRWKWLTD